MVHGIVIRVVRSVLLEHGDTASLAGAWLAVAVAFGASLLKSIAVRMHQLALQVAQKQG